MSAITTTKNNSTEDRALHLLGTGIAPEIVANACGVSVSRISQLLSNPEFTAKVAELRFQAIEKHNVIDSKYDAMEDKLLGSLQDCLPLIAMEPLKLLRAISVINAAKRRGVSAPEQLHAQNTVIQLIMPKVLMQKFTTNINNQVIHAGDQTLETIPSQVLARQYASEPELNTISAADLITSVSNHPSNINDSNTPPSNIAKEVSNAMQLLTAPEPSDI